MQIQDKPPPVEEEAKETSLAISKKEKNYIWEHEIVWFLIDDINNATKFLETKKEDLFLAETDQELDLWEYNCASDTLKLAVGNVQTFGKRINNAVVKSDHESWFNLDSS